MSWRWNLTYLLLVSLLSTVPAHGGERAKTPVPKDGPLGMKFVPLPQGTFYMGGFGGVVAGRKAEIKEDFELAVTTVTQGQWQVVMGKNPSHFSREGGGKEKVKDIKDEDLKQFPVEMVSWGEAQEFIKKLNEQEKGKGYLYRLPSSAEWEYACRGGATAKEESSYDFCFEKPTNDVSSKLANFHGEYPAGKGEKGTYLGRTTKVGSYAPNKLGLYDMHGNVWQWIATLDNSERLGRGGSWGNVGAYCIASSKSFFAPSQRGSNIGFRLARVPVR